MQINAAEKLKVGGLLATGLVSTVLFGIPVDATGVVSIAGKVIEALAPNFAHQFLSSINYSRFRDAITNPHPNSLNHDLEKLVAEALGHAVGYVNRLYLDRLRQEQDLTRWQRLFQNSLSGVEQVLRNLEADLRSELAHQRPDQHALQAYLLDKPENCFEDLTAYLFRVSGVIEQGEGWEEFRAFFRQELPRLFDLSFREALKDPANDRAFKAFHLWLLEEGYRQNQQLLAGQAVILEEIRLLKSGQDGSTTAALRETFERDVLELRALLESNFGRIFEQLNRMEQVGIETRDNTRILIDKFDQNQKPAIPHELTLIPGLGAECLGREVDLERLIQKLATSSRVVLMHSTGGIGKTTLAKWFVQQRRRDYDHVAWVSVIQQDAPTPGGPPRRGSVKETFADHQVLFNTLGLDFDPKNEGRFEELMLALRHLPGHNLLVVDNAGDDLANRTLREALPQPPGWRVLVTSRQRLKGFDPLPLESLSPAAARDLFGRHFTYPAEEQDITDLLKEISHHTLTVELFAKTLESHYGSLPVRDLLDKVRRRQLDDPALQRRIETEHSPEETEVFRHLMAAFDLSDLGTDEQILMQQLALLPAEGYTANQLSQWLGTTEVEAQRRLHESLHALTRKGWLSADDVAHTVTLHRLVQQVVLYQLPPSWEAAEPVIAAFGNLLEWSAYINVLDLFPQLRFAEYLLDALPEELLSQAKVAVLQNNLGLIIEDFGRYEQARDLLEASLASALKNFGQDHPNVAGRQSNLANVYRKLGDYAQARDLVEAALSSDLKNFGQDHPDVAVSQSNLAAVFNDSGDYTQARDLLKAALSSALKNFGQDHPSVAVYQSNLANVYRNLGDYAQARDLLEAALSSDLKNFGQDHPRVAVRQSNLANVYRNLGDYAQARDLVEAALSSDLKNFGQDHPSIAIRQSNLANVFSDLGDFKKAKALFEAAVANDLKNLGEEHPYTKMDRESLNNLLERIKGS